MAYTLLKPTSFFVCYFVACFGFILGFASSAIQSVAADQNLRWTDLSWQKIQEKEFLLSFSQEFYKNILTSEFGFLLLLNFFVSLYAFVGVLTTVVFLGRLSPAESKRLTERLAKHLLFKVIFVGAVMKPELDKLALWLAWFAITAYLKMFVGAAKDRLETLMGYPHALPWRHARALALLVLVLVLDALSAAAYWGTQDILGWKHFLLLLFDTAIVAVEGTKTLVHYGIYLLDRIVAWDRRGRASLNMWEAWDGKGSFLYHTELVADVLMHVMTLLHYLQIWILHGLSFHLVDIILLMDVRSIGSAMLRRIKGYSQYRTANHNLNHAFPDAAPAELVSTDCSICINRMTAAKKLPCGHAFHLACLRAWLQQSGNNFTCPMCRKPLFISDTHPSAVSGSGAPAAPHPVGAPHGAHALPLLVHHLFRFMSPQHRSLQSHEAHVAWIMRQAQLAERRERRRALWRQRVSRVRAWLCRLPGIGRLLGGSPAAGTAPRFVEPGWRMPVASADRAAAAAAAASNTRSGSHYLEDAFSLEDDECLDSDAEDSLAGLRSGRLLQQQSAGGVSTFSFELVSGVVAAVHRTASRAISQSTHHHPTGGAQAAEGEVELEDDGMEVTSSPSPLLPRQHRAQSAEAAPSSHAWMRAQGSPQTYS